MGVVASVCKAMEAKLTPPFSSRDSFSNISYRIIHYDRQYFLSWGCRGGELWCSHIHPAHRAMLASGRLLTSATSTLKATYEWLGLGREIPTSVQLKMDDCGLGGLLIARTNHHVPQPRTQGRLLSQRRKATSRGFLSSESLPHDSPKTLQGIRPGATSFHAAPAPTRVHAEHETWESSAVAKALMQTHRLQAVSLWSTLNAERSTTPDSNAPKEWQSRYQVCGKNSSSLGSSQQNDRLDAKTHARLKHRCRMVIQAYGF